jgi:methyl-accepting chemotaxis protein
LRNLLIRKEIQLGIVLLNIVLMVVAASVIILVVLTPVFDDLQLSDNLVAQSVSARLFILIADRLIFAVGAVLVLGVIYTLILTHRFCGPLENFSHTFQKMSQGDLTRKVFLRRNDFLKREAGQVNDMIDRLSVRLNSVRQQHQILKSKVAELAASNPPATDARKVFSELTGAVEACIQALADMKLN